MNPAHSVVATRGQTALMGTSPNKPGVADTPQASSTICQKDTSYIFDYTWIVDSVSHQPKDITFPLSWSIVGFTIRTQTDQVSFYKIYDIIMILRHVAGVSAISEGCAGKY